MGYYAPNVYRIQVSNCDAPVRNPVPSDSKREDYIRRLPIINRHANPPGADSAKVEARVLEDRIRIGVKDEGKGFDPVALEEKDGKMTGFGLFTIKERVEFAGGRFEIDSAPGKGCRVTLEAPKEVSRRSERPETTESEAVLKETEAGAPKEGRNIRILVADDHAVLRQGLSKLLATEPGIEVVGATAYLYKASPVEKLLEAIRSSVG